MRRAGNVAAGAPGTRALQPCHGRGGLGTAGSQARPLLLPDVSRETSVLVLCLARNVCFGLPCVRKNPTFGNRSPGFPQAGNSDLGLRRPKSRRRRPATAKRGGGLPKVGFFRTWGGENATAQTLPTDAPTGNGGVWNAIWRITLWRVLPPRFRAVFTRMVRFRGSEGGMGRRGAGRPGRRARRPRGAARSPGRPLVFARILPETPLPRARDVRQCPGFVDVGWAIACGKWVRSRWRKWQRRRGTAMLRAVSCALSRAASAGASRARAPSCS